MRAHKGTARVNQERHDRGLFTRFMSHWNADPWRSEVEKLDLEQQSHRMRHQHLFKWFPKEQDAIVRADRKLRARFSRRTN